MHLTQVSTLKIVLCLPLSSLPEKSFSLRTKSAPFWGSNGELAVQIALSFWALKPPHFSRYIITYSKIAQTQLLSICSHTSFGKCWMTFLSWIYRMLEFVESLEIIPFRFSTLYTKKMGPPWWKVTYPGSPHSKAVTGKGLETHKS